MVQRELAPTLLTMWERAYGLGPVQKGLTLLSIARPQQAIRQLVNLTIGERDAALLDLRVRLFGSQIESVASCPQCPDKIQVSFSVSEIRLSEVSRLGPLEVQIDDRSATIWPLTSADLLAVEVEPSARLRREALLQRCISCSDFDTTESLPAQFVNWSDSAQRTIAETLARIDPQADIRIALSCSRCSHAWSSRFDITSHLWSEIDAWAQRLMAEIHALAFAYGWAERDILAMTPWRRHLYMGMLRR